jgi:phenylpropionate dioxygenase-like ring-hydroxylating dioxygenase large terminal subunit
MSAASDLMSTSTTWKQRAQRALHRSWFPVARSVDLDSPQAATLLGRPLVVYRTASGRAVVQDARCLHRGASLTLGKVVGEGIACPYHGWQYEAEQGRCVHIPSLDDQGKIHPKARIRTFPSLERFGHVWTVLEQPLGELCDPAEWRGVDFEWLAGDILESPTGVAVAIENFADVAHFAFVHTAMMGPTPPQIEPLNVRREGLDVWMDRPLGLASGEWAKDGPCMMHYHIVAPGFIAITYDYERLGRRIVAGFPSPVAYDQVRIFWGVANERGYRGADLAECLKIEDLLYREDLPTAATIEPREVDWDGDALEFSVPADLYTLSYRRAFKEFIERAADAGAG